MVQFDILNKAILICARRGAGKSYLTRHIIKTYKYKYDAVFLMCSTAFNGDYDGLIPKENIYEKYSDKWISVLLEKMAKVNNGTTNDKARQCKHVLLILDDLISDVKFHAMKGIQTLFTRGRHHKITVIITSQYLKSIPPVMRVNSDYIFFGRQNKQSIEVLEEEFRQILERNDFIDMVNDALSVDHQFLVVNNVSSSMNTDDIYGVVRVTK